MKDNTYTRLNGDDTTSGESPPQSQVTEKDVLVGLVRVATSVVGVHAKIVAQPMGEERSAGAGLEDVLRIALQDSQLEQPVDSNLVSNKMDVVPQLAGLDLGHGIDLHLVDDVVDLAGFFGEFAVEGECTCLVQVSRLMGDES